MPISHGRSLAVAALLLGCARPALPCTVLALTTPADLVNQAAVILIARADGLSAAPGDQGLLAASPTQVDFTVISVLKGEFPARTITFNGMLTSADERNRGDVPYAVARASADSSCHSIHYRVGGRYLLFLRRAGPGHAQGDKLTPYWAPLAPANEQLFGDADPWSTWVRDALRRNGALKPGA